MTMLEIIIELGMQLLQTTEGEKLPRVIATAVQQRGAEPARCQFTMFVNGPGLCKYDDRAKTITTPAGNLLRFVKVIKHQPPPEKLDPEFVLCECQAAFRHDTGHRKHFGVMVAT